MAILVTGAGGFLSKALIPLLLGDTVYALYHKPPKQHIPHRLRVLVGDILKPDLGLKKSPSGIDAIYHLAALVNLGDRHKDKTWRTNVDGTRNVLSFMKSHNIHRLVFLSTAYSQHRNAYETSKEQAERDILSARATQGLKVSIIKPSIIIGSKENPGTDQTVNHFALTVAKIHRRAETARRKVQDTLALPPLQFGFRVSGDPQATLNVIPVEVVAGEIAKLKKKEGVFFITNPNPPLLEEVADEIGEAVGLNIKILKEFRASPPEKLLEKLIKPFLVYMQGEPRFPTIVPRNFKLSQNHVRDMVTAFLS